MYILFIVKKRILLTTRAGIDFMPVMSVNSIVRIFAADGRRRRRRQDGGGCAVAPQDPHPVPREWNGLNAKLKSEHLKLESSLVEGLRRGAFQEPTRRLHRPGKHPKWPRATSKHRSCQNHWWQKMRLSVAKKPCQCQKKRLHCE